MVKLTAAVFKNRACIQTCAGCAIRVYIVNPEWIRRSVIQLEFVLEDEIGIAEHVPLLFTPLFERRCIQRQ